MVKQKLKIPVWRTIRHVGKRNFASYCAGLSGGSFRISELAYYLIGGFETTSVDVEVDLGLVTGTDLGLREKTRFDVFCDHIVKYGGTRCLPEDGPVLREQYTEQSRGEWLRLAMKSIRSADHRPSLLTVHNDRGVLWLDGFDCYADNLCDPGSHFIVRLGVRPLAT